MVITEKESTALKGLCIVSIVLHNVLHILTDAHENEFVFSSNNVSFFFDKWVDYPFSYLFSFYGWLGVSFFVFISGYGLTVKYGCKNTLSFKWLKRHYLKLVLLLFPAFLVPLSLLLYKYPNQGIVDYGYFISELLLLLNIINPHLIRPGVFWYIGIAFQFYLWFLLFRKLSDKSLLLIALCSCILIAFLPMNGVSYVRHNSIGWMSEFVLGILLARHNNIVIGKHCRYTTFFLCICLFLKMVLFSVSRYTFFLSGLCFIGILLVLRKYFVKSTVFLFLGRISACIYVVHPVIRQIWLGYISPSLPSITPPVVACIILLISIGVSVLYNQIYVKTYKKWI